MSTLKIPLFPLHTVLFPGGVLPLRIFEARYLDMVSHCLRTGGDFGICLIREGNEVGEAATTHEVGTLATIIDWDQRSDGLLGIDVQGGQRFRLLSHEVLLNQRIEAVVELLADEPAIGLPEAQAYLAALLAQFIEQVGRPYNQMLTYYDSANWVGQRLAELLPMAHAQKQYLLELNDPLQRLETIEHVLKTLNVRS
ncbi:LON peptidase substrate-binding domain-containing protein [Beggiatoa leptomitoformis]|uniref:Peptidase S16 n=1 Tax=Beggiatoa leptomitoformis TaxID=288004 RepID=A0A2N9YE42_9GAMM|nr:LON peptidase substrate-binding domain-containing protein [Beggiatoa leptomitoformis]ALG68893.1 peptidase S16 [Beggiatoa leptomitoformis]AUI68734.1 peptidase S16 [Beggiatoa leptomitoformis]